MNPLDVTVEVEIGGEKRKLYFNLNAFSKFEEASSIQADGKRLKFPRFFFGLLDAWSRLQKRRDSDIESALLDAIGEIGASDVLALIYGALHEYDAQDNPRWPLSPGRLGRLLNATELVKLLPQVMTALQANVPQKSDAPEPKGGEESKRPTMPAPLTVINGGSAFGAPDETPLGFLTEKSAG